MTLPTDSARPDHSSVDQSALTAALAQIVEERATIEQVKGILMLVYRIDGNDAFALLQSRSQNSNIKLRKLAKALLPDLVTLQYRDEVSLRRQVDQLLGTVCPPVAPSDRKVASTVTA
jgi:hypothetical protein